jgi:hypothetical protein
LSKQEEEAMNIFKYFSTCRKQGHEWELNTKETFNSESGFVEKHYYWKCIDCGDIKDFSIKEDGKMA